MHVIANPAFTSNHSLGHPNALDIAPDVHVNLLQISSKEINYLEGRRLVEVILLLLACGSKEIKSFINTQQRSDIVSLQSILRNFIKKIISAIK